jgi:hypothetical protein
VTVDAGSDPSLALDSVGNPVVSYVWAGLKILHCNDANCAAGGDSITTPDASNGVGENSSLALDGSGFPVVAYHDNSANLDLKLMHCNDANCGGGDESITVPDGPGTVGSSPSLVLDASGNPVVTYAGNPGLRLLHCDDPDCSGGGDSITTPDSGAGFFSLALDAAGNPVVAYRDLTNLDLKVLHCDDPNCSGGGDTIASPDEFGDTGFAPSLTLDNVGRPVVSYQFNTGPDRHLRILHCGNPTCSGPNMLVSGDLATWVGDDSSIVLDAAGNPVVSYYDAFFSDLKLLHCADRACVGGVGGETQLTDIAGATTDSSDWSLFVATSVMLMIMLGAGVYGLQRRQSRR